MSDDAESDDAEDVAARGVPAPLMARAALAPMVGHPTKRMIDSVNQIFDFVNYRENRCRRALRAGIGRPGMSVRGAKAAVRQPSFEAVRGAALAGETQPPQFLHAQERGLLGGAVLRHRHRRVDPLQFALLEHRFGAGASSSVGFLGHA
jgi:hypothetical protein